MRPNLWIVVVVERKIDISGVAFTANGNNRPRVTLPCIRKWTGLQTLQNICYRLDLWTWNYKFFCLDTTSRTNITSESASDENWAWGAQRWEHLPSFPRDGGRVGGGGAYGRTPYNDLNGVTPTESSTFFMSQLYERVGLLLVLCLAEGFFSRCSGFPLSPKTNLSKFQFHPERTDTSLGEFLTTSKCSAGKRITN